MSATVSVYELTGHLTQKTPLPRGVMAATIKTDHVAPVQRTKHMLAHRAVYAVTAEVRLRVGEGVRRQLGARYLCGGSSIDVRPLANVAGLKLCPKCERRASIGPDRWTIYGYFDNEGAPLYVGQTMDLNARHQTHSKSAAWFPAYAQLRVLSVHDERREALSAERDAIAALRPQFNVTHNSLRLVRGGAA